MFDVMVISNHPLRSMSSECDTVPRQINRFPRRHVIAWTVAARVINDQSARPYTADDSLPTANAVSDDDRLPDREIIGLHHRPAFHASHGHRATITPPSS